MEVVWDVLWGEKRSDDDFDDWLLAATFTVLSSCELNNSYTSSTT